jgi:23S rRNA pseudouridine2605 synthase
VVVNQPGSKVEAGVDTVTVDGKVIGIERLRYILFHKPTGCVTTRHDPEGRPTVFDILPVELHHLQYVGRLDLTTTGALLLTNDGQLSYRLTRPEYKVEKTYEVKLRGAVNPAVLRRAEAGIEDRGELLKAKKAYVTHELTSNTMVEVVLTEGRNREVRRLFESQGIEVVRLSRIAFAGLNLIGLEPGEWRELTPREVNLLMDAAGEGTQ